MGSDFEFAPTFKEHIIDGDHLEIYAWFWGFGAPCLLLGLIATIPHWRKVFRDAKFIRDKTGTMMLPTAHSIVLLILALPVVTQLAHFISLLSPISYLGCVFIAQAYQGLCMLGFGRLLVIYLGTFSQVMDSLQGTAPTNHWASPPLCCFRCVCKPSHISEKSFRFAYYLVLQYAIVPPALSFVQMGDLFQSNGESTASTIISVFQSLTTIGCIYGLQVMMKSSAEVLEKYETQKKFGVVQLVLLGTMLPQVICNLVGIDGVNDEYDSTVMNRAWSSFITTIICTLAAKAFTLRFTCDDTMVALKLMSEGYVKMSQSLESIQVENLPSITGAQSIPIDAADTASPPPR